MKTKIKEAVENSQLNVAFCEKYHLKLFEEKLYTNLEKLGKGGFGKVWKCVQTEQTHRTLVAVKYIAIPQDKQNREETIENIESFFIEKHILERINQEEEAKHLFPLFYGAFFLATQSGIIEYMVLVSEAGDFNLHELIQNRKQKSSFPFSATEALSFLCHIVPAFLVLEKIRIYHSDLKPQNIVYSKNRGGFMVIDFGGAKEIPQNQQYLLKDYGDGGTPAFLSPERKNYQNATQNHLESVFDPFACDMWSLWKILERMVVNDQGNQILKAILEGIKAEDWRVRWTATGLHTKLKEYELGGSQQEIEILSQECLNIIIMKNKEKLGYLRKRYKDASLPNEQLEIALAELKFIKDQGFEDDEAPEYDLAYMHLG